MKINWGLRLKSKKYWLTVVVPVAVIIIGSVLTGVDSNQLTTQLTAIVTGVFGLFSYLGGTVDPTTPGLSDSDQAMRYTAKSKKSLKEQVAEQSKQINELTAQITALSTPKGDTK